MNHGDAHSRVAGYERLAGTVFALLVVVPVLLLPMFMNDAGRRLDLRGSPWMLVPVLGGALAGGIMRRGRVSAVVFGGMAGLTGAWCALTWGAGSEATSEWEIMAATGVGMVPVMLVYALCRRIVRPWEGVQPNGGEHFHAVAESPFQKMAYGEIFTRFWKQILFFGGAFVIMTVMTVMDLNHLESGAVESVTLWEPIVSFYQRFGYWPAVLLPPCTGVACGLLLLGSLRKFGKILGASGR